MSANYISHMKSIFIELLNTFRRKRQKTAQVNLTENRYSDSDFYQKEGKDNYRGETLQKMFEEERLEIKDQI